MKIFLITFGLLLTQTGLAEDLKLNCWDGTFFYNRASVLEVDDGYEVSISGTGNAETRSSVTIASTPDVQILGRRGTNTLLLVKFSKSECLTSADRKQISCSLNIPQNGFSRNVFGQIRAFDISERGVTPLTLRGSVKQLQFELNASDDAKKQLILVDLVDILDRHSKFEIKAYQTGDDIVPFECGMNQIHPGFSEELRAFLKRHPSN